jgi:hypothetical protein
MNRGLGYEPRKEPVCRNFTKILLSRFFVPTTTTSLYYLTSACLPLPQGSPSQPFLAKVSTLSLSLLTSSFPAHSASTDIPLTVCLQYPFLLLICVALLLSSLNSSFCLAPCSLALFSLALCSGLFSVLLSYLALLPAPCMLPAPSCFSLAPLSGLVYLGSSD